MNSCSIDSFSIFLILVDKYCFAWNIKRLPNEAGLITSIKGSPIFKSDSIFSRKTLTSSSKNISLSEFLQHAPVELSVTGDSKAILSGTGLHSL